METIDITVTILEALIMAMHNGANKLELKQAPNQNGMYWTFYIHLKRHTFYVVTENVNLPEVWEIDDKLKKIFNEKE